MGERGTRVEGAEGERGRAVVLAWVVLVIGLVVGLCWYLKVGTVATGWGEVWKALWGAAGLGGKEALAERWAVVIWEIRLPRGLGAMLVGGALAAAGACLQGLFRNPLADPGLIGVSSGGALGAMVGIATAGLVEMPGWAAALYQPWLAMSGALGTTALVYAVARMAGRTHLSTLLLAGIAINALAGAIIGGVLYLSDNEALRRFTFWTLGSLHTVTWDNLAVLAPFTLVPMVILPRYRRALNAFLLGEAEAYHLGFATQRVKLAVIALCAAMVGVAVAFCGLIGFVGLVVPHVVRLVSGPDFRLLLPGSWLAGALLMLWADLLARTANAPAEVPLGVITALLGAPFFLWLIYRRKRQLGV